MDRKDIAVSFLRLASSGRVSEAYNRFVHSRFRHHNPYFHGDRESLLKGMEDNAVEFPDKEFEVVQVLGEDNRVAVHGRIRLRRDLPEIALIHIFRFENDLIIEEWEAAQEVPANTVNENGMF